jgi:putative peptide zinc metalloprotease protein
MPGASSALPALREELALYPGPSLSDGQPSWTLHDPVRNQFFRIDWLGFEILSRWSLGELHAIVASISEETTLHPDATDVDAVVRFLATNQLVQIGGGKARSLAEMQARTRGDWKTWLLHHYLFFRIPLVHPDAWLDRWVPHVAPFFTRSFAYLTAAALVLGLLEVWRDWERFSSTLVDTFTLQGLASYGVALFAVKLLHELGHAFTAKRYGCRIPAMGIAFLVMFPVAYTDTNEVWKLSDRRQRLAVAAAGVITELVIAIWATLAWALLPEGAPRSVAFMLATTTWIATLTINTSPFMRFDGYFLLSDWLDMPNLHGRAFALARWDLRERLFGLGVPPPEIFPPARRRGLVLFAYATWVYRLVVFLGIAALVYAFFIKAIGVLLFLVEIGWFVARPVWSELGEWPAILKGLPGGNSWRGILRNGRARRSLLLILIAGGLVFLPWPTRLSASALLKPADVFPVYAPAGTQVVKLPFKEGATVKAGELLLELASPELQQRWSRTQAKLDRLHWQAGNAEVDTEQRQNLQVLQEEEKTAQSGLASIQAELQQYAPVAPFAGILRDLEPDLKPGAWVANRERLAVLVKPARWQVETWLDEDAVHRIKVGDHARFVTDSLEGPALALTVDAIDLDATRVLPSAELATRFGGSITTRERQGQLVPERAMYRVTLSGDDGAAKYGVQSWRGQVFISGSWEAPAVRFMKSALVLVWREFGF